MNGMKCRLFAPIKYLRYNSPYDTQMDRIVSLAVQLPHLCVVTR